MKLPNPQQETLQQLLPRIAANYPNARIKKVLWTPEAIFVPHDNFKFVVRRHKQNLKIDHTLPVIYVIGAVIISVILVSIVMSIIYGRPMLGVGGALWIVLGIFTMKYIFQQVKKDEFLQFRNELTSMISGFDFDRNSNA
jgi:hypothetical protein